MANYNLTKKPYSWLVCLRVPLCLYSLISTALLSPASSNSASSDHLSPAESVEAPGLSSNCTGQVASKAEARQWPPGLRTAADKVVHEELEHATSSEHRPPPY